MKSLIITALLLSSLPFIITLPHLTNLSLPSQPLTSPPKPYTISYCGDRTSAVEAALDAARAALPSAIAEAKLGTASPYGFTAFFKTSSSKKSVTAVLESIRDLKAIRGRWPKKLRSSRPEFVCVYEGTRWLFPELGFDPWVSGFCVLGVVREARGSELNLGFQRV